MNEGFQLRLRRNGRTWPIDAFDANGIILSNERDAFPRSVTLEFDARSDVTRYRMNRVRQLKGWDGWQFNLKATLRDGMLAFAGDDPHSLPGGAYWLRVSIADLTTPSARLKLNIAENQPDARVDVDVTVAPQKVALTRFGDFDSQILAVLQPPESSLDGQSIEQWLSSGNTRPSRKACLLNLLAKLRTVPEASAPLISDVRSIFFAGTERVYGQVTANMFTRLQALARDPKKPFYSEGDPASPTHRKLLDQIEARGWGKCDDYTLHSFRQEGRTCMQIVVATPSVGTCPFCADFDIDLGNPLEDVDGFVVHMGELALGGDTNHLELRDTLATGAMKPFLYYTVV
jgi:hypothetical protein